jgi:hypothetical protein
MRPAITGYQLPLQRRLPNRRELKGQESQGSLSVDPALTRNVAEAKAGNIPNLGSAADSLRAERGVAASAEFLIG